MRTFWPFFPSIYLSHSLVFLSLLLSFVSASPLPYHLENRSSAIIKDVSGQPQVFSGTTGQLIPQASGSDGSGNGYNAIAISWIIFSLLIGPPLAFAGLRGGRITGAVGTGLASAVCAWAAFITTTSTPPLPDILLVILTLSLFLLGCILGLFRFWEHPARMTGGIVGGLAVGVRMVLFREDLLIHNHDLDALFFLNWLIVAVLGVGGGVLVVFRRRVGIALGSASSGTFLIALGIDLAMNKQAGLSRGLRYLFDRNTNHFSDILLKGYTPLLSTIIVLSISLGLTPILAYAQWRLFPLKEGGEENDTWEEETFESADLKAPGAAFGDEGKVARFSRLLKSRFSM